MRSLAGWRWWWSVWWLLAHTFYSRNQSVCLDMYLVWRRRIPTNLRAGQAHHHPHLQSTALCACTTIHTHDCVRFDFRLILFSFCFYAHSFDAMWRFATDFEIVDNRKWSQKYFIFVLHFDFTVYGTYSDKYSSNAHHPIEFMRWEKKMHKK